MRFALLTLSILLWSSSAGFTQTPAASQLRVGAAKVDITPEPSAQPVLDRLHSRAIVIADGETTAALITVDTIAINDNLWRTVTGRLEKELDIPARNVFLTATHTHSGGGGGSTADKIVTSVSMAKDRLQPARMGYGTGVSYINVNRAIIDPQTRLWREGPNYDGASDKTVAVITFETPAGDPIAVYFNYAVHGVIAGTLGMVSADVPGAASNYVEDSFDNRVVALWSTGPEGDQNPIYFQQTFDVREFQTQALLKQGRDFRDSIPPMNDLDRTDPTVMRIERQQKQMLLTMGQMLGEEVLRVMRLTGRTVSSTAISSNQTTVSCPGRQRTDRGVRAGVVGAYSDAAEVPLRLSLLNIGDIALAGVNAEVYSGIGMRLKNESPNARTMMVTLTNGSAPSGYVPNDAAYAQLTFEVLGSRLKPGCAESAIVNGVLDMMSAGEKR
jgi:hypothetical protein